MAAAKSPGDRVGDGKVFVLSLDQVYRIRTGEEGVAAIGP